MNDSEGERRYICDENFTENELLIQADRNRGIEIRIYVAKYIDAMVEDISLATSIHPICPIDEYAINGRSWVWFRPPIPPTMALADPIIKERDGWELENENSIIDTGISFCHVVSSKQMIQFLVLITRGNQ